MDPFEFRTLKADDAYLGRNHKCISVDLDRGYVCHRDCADCGCVVYIEQSGPGGNDFDVPLDEGGVCSNKACRAIVCTDCIERNTPTGKPLCGVCYIKARNEALDADELFDSLHDAKVSLEQYRAALHVEKDPVRIRRSVLALTRLEDMFATVNSELLPNIERAAGLQQVLLPRGSVA